MKVEVLSPVAGTVAFFNVDEGLSVAAGEEICSVESMKTFFAVHAPVAGRLRYLATLGEIVGQDDPIAEIITEG